MKKLAQVMMVSGTGLLLTGTQAIANAPSGDGPPDYSGISGMYYTLIGLVLAYGVYDSFFKKL